MAFPLCGLALGCASLTNPLVHVSEGRPAMGTILEITLVTSDREKARAVIARCFAESERLEMIFTTWREDGELARLNARAGQGPQQSSPELLRILGDAQGFARQTSSAFDVTVGPLVQLWREAGERNLAPTDAEILAARALVGAERIRIDDERGTLTLEAGMSIDLGGLAKGWTLDRLGELLGAEGFARLLLNFGGSSLHARGAPLDAPAWRIAVDGGESLELNDADVSISASFGQTLEIAGERLGHIIDPRTGRPLRQETRTTVSARDGSTAEAWSTALVVLGTDGLSRVPCDSGIRARVTTSQGEQRTHCPGDAK